MDKSEIHAMVLGPEQSHRIIAVLEEAAEKLGFLGSITPDVLQHRDELSKFVGDEISRIIQVGTHCCEANITLSLCSSTFSFFRSS